MNGNLERELMAHLRELTKYEQDSLQVLSAIYVNFSEKIKEEKAQSYGTAFINQVGFYGRNKDDYYAKMNEILAAYSNLMTQVVAEYTTRFVAVISELQELWNNQKVAMVNQKIAIDQGNEIGEEASANKVSNFEIVIQECVRQLEECKDSLQKKMNEIFYDKDKALSLRKPGIFQKIINLFAGKSKLERCIDAWQVELANQEKVVAREIESIQKETVENVAIIKDGILQIQEIYKNMVGV